MLVTRTALPTKGPAMQLESVTGMQIDSKAEAEILGLKGGEWLRLGARQRERLAEACFQYWRARGFPYYRLTGREMTREYERLASARTEGMILGDEIQMSMVGVKLANCFHPQMWAVQVGRWRSPLECFNNDKALREVVRKALSVFPDRYSVNESNMRRMLRTFRHTAAVSNFRPTAARAIYELYSREGDSVVDFSAGYGGRMLGCLPMARHYIGIDPCTRQVRGLLRMHSKLRLLPKVRATISIHRACAEEFLRELKSRSVSLVFSSPPYFNNERYSDEPSQSYVRYPEYQNWLKHFIGRIIAESRRILKTGGHFVVNVADTNGIPLTSDMVAAASRHFRLTRVLKLRLGNLPYHRHRTGNTFKYEPVLVFQKLSG